MKSTSDIYKIVQESENILIGAGAGLSTAAGLLYADKPFFDKMFPGYSERYGLTGAYEAAFHEFSTLEEHYTYWARHIKTMRLDFPVGEVYLQLLDLVKDKNYFVITTNADGQFEKAGFDREKMFTPQGDYAFFQCSKPCSNKLYPSGEWARNMLDGLTDKDFAGSRDNIPYCPDCGELLVPNLRKDDSFVEAPWMEKQEDYAAFVNSLEGELILFELGVGFNTPGIIRFPFEQLAAQRKNTSLIRVNQDTRLYIKEAEEYSLIVEQPIEKFFNLN